MKKGLTDSLLRIFAVFLLLNISHFAYGQSWPISISGVTGGTGCVGSTVSFGMDISGCEGQGCECNGYNWSINNAILGTHYTILNDNQSLTDSYLAIKLLAPVSFMNVSVYASCGSGTSDYFSITSSAVPSVGIAITNGSNPLCPGSSLKFSASVGHGGTNPVYSWRIGGHEVQAGTSSTLTTDDFSLGTDVMVYMFPDLNTSGCVTEYSVPSNTINVTIRQPDPVSVSIAAVGDGKVCANGPILFTANPVNAGSNPLYTWKINGGERDSDDLEGLTPGIYFKVNNWVWENGSYVTLDVTNRDVGACISGNGATSNFVYPDVIQRQTFSVSVSIENENSGNTYCTNTISFRANPSHAASNYTWYQTGSTGAVASGPSPVYTPSPESHFETGNIVSVLAEAANPECLNNNSATGDSPSGVTITPNVSAGTITGVDSRCQGAGTTTFVPSPGNATSITWTILTAQAGTIDGNGIVTWNENFFGSATIRMVAHGCGPDVTREKTIQVKQTLVLDFDFPSPADDICPYESVSFGIANSVNFGITTPLIEWYFGTTPKTWYDSEHEDDWSFTQEVAPVTLSFDNWNNRPDGMEIKVRVTNNDNNVCVAPVEKIAVAHVKPPGNFGVNISTNANNSMNVFCDGSITFIAEAGTLYPASSYTWFHSGIPGGAATGSTYTPLNFSQGDVVSVLATAAANGCLPPGTTAEAIFTESVTIYPKPSVPIGVKPIYVDYNESVILDDGTHALPGEVSGANANEAYHWYNEDMSSLLNTTEAYYQTPLLTGNVIYKVKIYNIVVDDCASEAATQEVYVYPPNNYNLIREEATLTPDNKLGQEVDDLDVDRKKTSVNYINGLGSSMQSIVKQGSPGKRDIVQPVVYDRFGRETVKYLPYVDEGATNGWFKKDFVDKDDATYTSVASPQWNFYQPGGLLPKDDIPYSESIIEKSPLNRILKQGAPGSAWKPLPDAQDHADHSIKKQYGSNTGIDVYFFVYDPATTTRISLNGNYGEGQLYGSITYDELNNETIEFVDKQGRIVCKKVQYDGEGENRLYTCTYYIYDDLGNLVIVLPPEAVKLLIQP